jgi:hypothetical protein
MNNNTGLKNEVLISELLTSGSLALPAKNEYGVHLFDSKNLEDGVVSGKLVKPKYNEEELLKSVDTTIIELLPIAAPDLPDTVLRSIYNEATQSILDLRVEVRRLNNENSDLRAKVQELEIISQSLRVELDSKELVVAAAQNQSYQSNLKVSSTITELQNAIQKATIESIQRVSLFARNQSLEQELVNLREQLFGKEGKAAEGAAVSDSFSAKILEVANKDLANIAYRARANQNTEEWINGPTLELTNFTTNKTITVTFSLDGASIFNAPTQQTLAPGETKKIKLVENKNWIRDQKPKNSVGTSGDREYRGSLKITPSEGSPISLSTYLKKFRGSS